MQLFFARLCLDQAGSATLSYIGVVRAMGLHWHQSQTTESTFKWANVCLLLQLCAENAKHFPRNEKSPSFLPCLLRSSRKKKKNNSCDVTKGSNTFPKLAPTMTTLVHSAFVQNRRKVQQGIVFFFRRKTKPCCKQGAK